MPEWLAVSAAISSILSLVIAVGAIMWALLSPDVRAYLTIKWEYRQLRPRERDILKAVMTSRMGILIRQDSEISQSITLIPNTDGSDVSKSHISIAGIWYVSALEHLVSEGHLRKKDGEDDSIYILTSSGERFIEKFSKRLCSHQFTGRLRDGVHQAKLSRLNT